jgi:hypothetical protein
LCHRKPLAVVAVEQSVAGLGAQHESQLPGQVDRVLNAGVQSLCADGALNVCGVADQEDALTAEAVGDELPGVEPADPVRIAQRHRVETDRAQHFPEAAQHEFLVHFRGGDPAGGDEPKHAAVDGQDREEGALVEPELMPLVRVIRKSAHLDVGHDEGLILFRTVEDRAHDLPNPTASPVRTDHETRGDSRGPAIGVSQVAAMTVSVDVDVGQCATAFDGNAPVGSRPVEDAGGITLAELQKPRMVAFELGEVRHADDASALGVVVDPPGHDAGSQTLGGDAEHVEALQSARCERHGLAQR